MQTFLTYMCASRSDSTAPRAVVNSWRDWANKCISGSAIIALPSTVVTKVKASYVSQLRRSNKLQMAGNLKKK